MRKPTEPRPGEPIRLVQNKTGWRYRIVLDAGMKPDGRRRQITETHRSLTRARERVTEIRADVAKGTFTPPDKLKVAELCDRWAASKVDVRPVTLNTYKLVLKAVQARLGHHRVQELRASHISEFVGWLQEHGGRSGSGVSHRTLILTLGTLQQVFAYAVAEGLVPANPVVNVRRPRKRPQDNRQVTVWGPDQLRKFVEHTDGDRWAALWRLTACGLRRSEVCGLRWQDVNLDDGTVTIAQGRVTFNGHIETDDPKSSASARVVPVETMWSGTSAALKALKAQQAKDRLKAGSAWEESGYVLVDAVGRPMHPDHYSRRFRELVKEAGLPPIRLHDVRHSIATLLEQSGATVATASALLGHDPVVFMRTYVNPDGEGVKAAGAILARSLSAAQ